MNKKDEIDKIVKESFEKAKQLNSHAFWIIAKVAWIFIAIVIILYKGVIGD